MVRVIKLMIGCQGQWRAGKKDIENLGLWEVKAGPPPGANALPKYEPSIDYSHRGVGPYGPEADSRLPVPARHPVGMSEKWLYGDPAYPETYTG